MADNGFKYKNSTERGQEFTIAQCFFDKFPDLVKISRKGWTPLLKKLNEEELEQLMQLGIDLNYTPKHSYFKQQDGLILAFSRGESRGVLEDGTMGCVKYASDKNGGLYAIKIKNEKGEGNSTPHTSSRVAILDDERGANLFVYIGQSLDEKLAEKIPLSFAEKIKIARQLSWEVHKLNTGMLSTSKDGYAHHDIKPGNIALDSHLYPKLVDYGYADIVTNAPNIRGSSLYFPMTLTEMNTGDYSSLIDRFKTISSIEKDLFALKRTLYLGSLQALGIDGVFTENEYARLPKNLQQMLETEAVDITLQRKEDSALLLSLQFAAIEFSQDVEKSVKYSKSHQIALCHCLEVLDRARQELSQDDALIFDYILKEVFFKESEQNIMAFGHDLDSVDLKYQMDSYLLMAQMMATTDLFNEIHVRKLSSMLIEVGKIKEKQLATDLRLEMKSASDSGSQVERINKTIAIEQKIQNALKSQDLIAQLVRIKDAQFVSQLMLEMKQIPTLNRPIDVQDKIREIERKIQNILKHQTLVDKLSEKIAVMTKDLAAAGLAFLHTETPEYLNRYYNIKLQIDYLTQRMPSMEHDELQEKNHYLDHLQEKFNNDKQKIVNKIRRKIDLKLIQHDPFSHVQHAKLSRIYQDILKQADINHRANNLQSIDAYLNDPHLQIVSMIFNQLEAQRTFLPQKKYARKVLLESIKLCVNTASKNLDACVGDQPLMNILNQKEMITTVNYSLRQEIRALIKAHHLPQLEAWLAPVGFYERLITLEKSAEAYCSSLLH